MKILIIGNIASGKTTLGRKLSKQLGIPLIEIDKIREKYLHGKVSDEYFSLFHFLREAESDKSVILEFTGVGCHKYAVKRALELSGHKVLVIVCKTSNISILFQRLKNKKYSYKSPFNIEIRKHILFIERELKKDLDDNFWRGKDFLVIEVSMDTPEDIDRNIVIIKNVLKQILEK